ncbi:MAG: hypothetical protein QNJ98_00085 [Planctomycetota bacterium]|nr:hypothetical protein [Planctomycetota bacterium]
MRTWFVVGVLSAAVLLLLAGCGASGGGSDLAPTGVLINTPPTLTITEPSRDVVLSRGASTTIAIEYADDDPDDAAVTWITADLDCDETRIDPLGCATSGPRDEMDGITQQLSLNLTPQATTKEGVYTIVGTTWDGTNTRVTATAPGRVEVRNVAWAKLAGGTSYPGITAGEDVAALPDGSCLVTGTVSGGQTLGIGEANETTLDTGPFVARYGADGTLTWAKIAEGGGKCIAAFADGSYILAGLTFVARYDANGTLRWLKREGGFIEGVATYADGSCVVTGILRRPETFGVGEINETTITPLGYSDCFVARYGADGTLTWAKAAGSARPGELTSTGYGRDIAANADGSCVVTGGFSGSVTFGVGETNETTLTQGGQVLAAAFFVAHYGVDGTLTWARAVSSPGNAHGQGIATRADGSCVVTGLFEDTATFGAGEANETTLTSVKGGSVLSPQPSTSMFVASYGADGTLRWAKTHGGTDGRSNGFDIAAHADGSCVVTGSFARSPIFGAGEANATTLTQFGSTGLLVARYKADGTLSWAKTAAGELGSPGLGIAAVADGSCIVLGFQAYSRDSTFGAGEANETTLRPAADDGMFLARFNADGGF